MCGYICARGLISPREDFIVLLLLLLMTVLFTFMTYVSKVIIRVDVIENYPESLIIHSF